MVQEIVKKHGAVELVTGVQFCPYCLSTNMEDSEKTVKCLDCGMGKNKSGRR
jgi:hypothetical protein